MASSMPKDLSNLVNDFRGDPAEQLSLVVCGTRDVNDPNHIGNGNERRVEMKLRMNNNEVRVYFNWCLNAPTYGIINIAERTWHPEDPVCDEFCTPPEDGEAYPWEVTVRDNQPWVKVHVRLNMSTVQGTPMDTVPLLPEETIARLEQQRGEPLPTRLRYDYHRVVKELYNKYKNCAQCAVPGCNSIGEEDLCGFCKNCASSVNFPACKVCGLSFGFMTYGKHNACHQCKEC